MKKLLIIAGILILYGCQKTDVFDNTEVPSLVLNSTASSNCIAQAEELDYKIYPMTSDGSRVGDMAVLYDTNEQDFNIYFIKDIWNDPTNERHPWYAFESTDFYNYSETGEILASSTALCDQDFAIGAGSVMKNNDTYYAFYTGHNPNSGNCSNSEREAIMLATSNNPDQLFTKRNNFTTITVPKSQGFDENDNFRDPFVFEDGGQFHMLISARKNVNGTWRGVIAHYTSSDLWNWVYSDILYDGGDEIYWMMECTEVFKMGGYYYLIYSDQIGKNLYYRKSTTLTGSWSKPSDLSRFAGKGIFAAKSAIDQYGDRYLFGWKNNLSGDTDSGNWKWAGNLVSHKIYSLPNGDLAASIPHTLKNIMETNNYSITKNSQWGSVTKTDPNAESYNLISNANFDVANVIYDPVSAEKYKIDADVSFNSSNKDFGFMIGACDGYEDFYSLRFIPSENRFSFDKQNRSNLTTTSIAENYVPITLTPNTIYNIQIIIENSMVVVYINDKAALSNRIYKATNTNWGIFVDNSNVNFENIKLTTP
ncbi:glycoside hydrolase family 32 protein [Gramella sp. AN32]|uniref:beta-fructofuranosidase n=1 Tax=Christiangramia antarctica TaxID=2058158 RepID=A0ABW5XBB8_9FLAO|nr:glycoside hydrolase family 32 protein [Gramella sp. AN32]MCM4155457.1 hypothetical protein [Gramella sp. AN32]